MALSIGVVKGDTFYLNDLPVRVVAVAGFNYARLRIAEREYEINDLEAIEISPGVLVSCGRPRDEHSDAMSRLLIEAPREIRILRGQLYERQRGLPVHR